MAEKRMFAKAIIDSDLFLEMPVSTRLLYYDLGMRADDEGFVGSPKKIMRMIGASLDDMNILIARKFIIPFESGVVVIRHWKINNYLRSDRYIESIYTEEKSILVTDDKKVYHTQDEAISLGIPVGIPTVDTDKNRIDKNRIDKNINVHHRKDVDELFESLWKLYIRKEGKNQVSKKAKEELFEAGFDTVKASIDNYAKQKADSEKRYILMGSTFFNGRWKDYVEENVVEEKKDTNNLIQYPKEKEEIDEEYQKNFL